MKFVGKPRDYYDHQVYVWGEDPKIVYNRGEFWEREPHPVEGFDPVLSERKFTLDGEMRFRFNFGSKQRAFDRFLVVCGRLYPLVYADTEGVVWPRDHFLGQYPQPLQSWQIYRTGYHRKADLPREKWHRFRLNTSFYDWQEGIIDVKVGEVLPAMEELSKLVHQPIFLITHTEPRGRNQGRQHTVFTVDPRYPVTSEMGLGQFESADKLYQDVGYWLANVINPSPDQLPEARPPQTDVEKAQAHGFDKKVSFRKRKSG